MEKQIKVHSMEVPKEIIAWFFTEAEKHLLEIQLVEVIGSATLRVDVLYEREQRAQVMLLIERVNDYLSAEKERMKQNDEN